MALATQLAAPISNTATSFTLADTSTWLESSTSFGTLGAKLGTSGNFVVTLDYGTTNAEKILCSAMSAAGTAATFTVVQRNYDATAPTIAKNHSTGAVAVHTFDSSTAYLATIAPTAEADAQTALTNAATAQTTANTAQTTANTAQTTALGTQVTGKSAFSGTIPGSATQLRTFGWTQNVSAASAGTTITLPNSLFSSALLSAIAINANESAGPGAYCTVKPINVTSFTVFVYTAGGTKATSGTYQINFMVSGY